MLERRIAKSAEVFFCVDGSEEEEKRLGRERRRSNLTFSRFVPLTVIDLRLVLKQKTKKTFFKKTFWTSRRKH